MWDDSSHSSDYSSEEQNSPRKKSTSYSSPSSSSESSESSSSSDQSDSSDSSEVEIQPADRVMSRQISVTLKIVGKPEHDKQNVKFAASLSGADIMNYITLSVKYPVPPKYFLLVEFNCGDRVRSSYRRRDQGSVAVGEVAAADAVALAA